MFGLFKTSPTRKLQKEYEAKLKESRDLQRGGDVVAAAKAADEADEIRQRIEAAEKAG